MLRKNYFTSVVISLSVGTLCIGVAHGQPETALALCSNAPSLETQITACTVVVESQSTSEYALAHALGLRGQAFAQSERYEDAISDFSRALGLRFSNRSHFSRSHLFTNRALSYAFLGMRDEALEDLDTLIAINPSNLEAHGTRYQVLCHLGETNSAFAAILEIVELDGSPDAIADLQDILTDRGVYEGPIDGRLTSQTREATRSLVASQCPESSD